METGRNTNLSIKSDISFLDEMKKSLDKLNKDVTHQDLLKEMISDWRNELESILMTRSKTNPND